MARDGTIDWQKLQERIEKGLEEFRRLHGREPRSLQVIAKSDQPEDINKAYEDLSRNLAKANVIRKHQASLRLAEVAEEIKKRDGGTFEAACLTALNDDPSLYEA